MRARYLPKLRVLALLPVAQEVQLGQQPLQRAVQQAQAVRLEQVVQQAQAVRQAQAVQQAQAARQVVQPEPGQLVQQERAQPPERQLVQLQARYQQLAQRLLERA